MNLFRLPIHEREKILSRVGEAVILLGGLVAYLFHPAWLAPRSLAPYLNDVIRRYSVSDLEISQLQADRRLAARAREVAAQPGMLANLRAIDPTAAEIFEAMVM